MTYKRMILVKGTDLRHGWQSALRFHRCASSLFDNPWDLFIGDAAVLVQVAQKPWRSVCA